MIVTSYLTWGIPGKNSPCQSSESLHFPPKSAGHVCDSADFPRIKSIWEIRYVISDRKKEEKRKIQAFFLITLTTRNDAAFKQTRIIKRHTFFIVLDQTNKTLKQTQVRSTKHHFESDQTVTPRSKPQTPKPSFENERSLEWERTKTHLQNLLRIGS